MKNIRTITMRTKKTCRAEDPAHTAVLPNLKIITLCLRKQTVYLDHSTNFEQTQSTTVL